MDKTFFSLLIVVTLTCSCTSKMKESNRETEDELKAMLGQIDAKFPGDQAFNSIMFSFDEVLGNSILVKVSGNADSLKIREWFFINDNWEPSIDIMMNDDSLSYVDHFFNLERDYNLSTLTSVLSTATKQLEDIEGVDEYVIKSINLKMGNLPYAKSKMENLITQVSIESLPDKKKYLVNFNVEGGFISLSLE